MQGYLYPGHEVVVGALLHASQVRAGEDHQGA